jgi:hypothetical protein
MKLREKDIQAHIADLDVAIRDLQLEKRALENLLVKLVAKEISGEATNKRSYSRIYNEEKIRQALRPQATGLIFKVLAQRLRRAGVTIKDPTLRSYLTRMSIKGELTHDYKTKLWSLKK